MAVKPLTVENPSFALDASARDCPPVQFVREFTVNAIEAIDARAKANLGHVGPRQVVWREFKELAGRLPAPKLACIDTGIGMTPDELERYVNSLAATSKTQALDANYGMGAKIAGAVGNPAGLTYLSWTGGESEGYTCTLKREPETGKWGLEEDASTGELVMSADSALCPSEIRAAGWRGTVVVFHGRSPDEDTTQPPRDDLGVDWLERAINVRFYALPKDVIIRCQRTGDTTRRALGQRALLAEHTEKRGSARLSDATVHWYILREETQEKRRKQNGRWAATGHRAALYKDELYELRSQSAGGFRKLQEFGITFGYARVVLYVEPDHALPDTVRAHLIMEGDAESKDLPWDRWADEFVADMPRELRELVNRTAGEQAHRDRREIMRRLERIAAEMPVPRYRASDEGPDQGGAFTHSGHGEKTARRKGHPSAGDQPGSAQGGNLVTLFTQPGGPPVEQTPSNRIPEIKPLWVRAADGTRVPPILEDRAADFLRRQGVVQLNEDFRGYRVLLSYFGRKYGHIGGGRTLVEAEVKAACEDLVIEFIVGVLRLRSQPHWTREAEDHALDDRALTGCLMQHATLAARVDERLARRLRRAA